MFQFNTQADGELYNSLSSLVKKNNGQFKSVKQAEFLFKRLSSQFVEDGGDYSLVKKYFGIDMIDGQIKVEVQAHMRWADYGAKSHRPITWVFVLDQHGVVGQYKLGYVGDLRSGCSPDPMKTKVLWQRQGEVVPLAKPEVIKADEPVSEHIGTVGARVAIEGVIKSVSEFARRTFHYYDSGVGYVTRIDVAGSDVVYFGHLGDKGETVSIKATIKEHGEYKGRKQTVISRPKHV